MRISLFLALMVAGSVALLRGHSPKETQLERAVVVVKPARGESQIVQVLPNTPPPSLISHPAETFQTLNVLPENFEIDPLSGLPVLKKVHQGSEEYARITELPEGFALNRESGLVEPAREDESIPSVYVALSELPEGWSEPSRSDSKAADSPYQQISQLPEGFVPPSQ